MNKKLMMAIVATLIIAGCSDQQSTEPDQSGSSSVEKALESASGAMSDMKDAAGDAIDSTADMASDAADAVTEMAGDAKDRASEMVSDAGNAISEVSSGGAAGEKIYQQTCQGCHATGAAGAPKVGDKEAWAPRIATGMDALLGSAIKGKGVMPPKGTCMSCSEADLKAAVEYMVSQSK